MMTYGRICNHESIWCFLLLSGDEQRKDEEEVERQADEVADGSLGDRTNQVTLHDGDQNFRQLFLERYALL